MKKLLSIILAGVIGLSALNAKKFEPTLESFEENYEFPQWFRDAKFGIWSHWGPSAMSGVGGHGSKAVYWQGHEAYDWLVENYGHPSEYGYKDVVQSWKAENLDVDKLMRLYKKAGARYFVSMGVHHDNFWLWDSKIHRWNSANMGPKKDIVGLWKTAAKNEGMYFGVSEHLGAAFTWFQSNKLSDKKGPLKGVPYDGNNPEYQDLYFKPCAPDDQGWYTNNPENHQQWYNAIIELIDLHHPDLLYSDGGLAFEGVGLDMIAHYYNDNGSHRKGEFNAIYTCKSGTEQPYWVLDFEMGKLNRISKYPWQTDTSIGSWFFKKGEPYKTSTEIIQMLVDIVSKNGNLLLNIIQKPDGDLEPRVYKLLDELAVWFEDNGVAIHGTRPWKIYGEGPSTKGVREAGNHGGIKETESTPLTSRDFRFTQKNGKIYAFCMRRSDDFALIRSFSKSSDQLGRAVRNVRLLGVNADLNWKQRDDGLFIEIPTIPIGYETVCFEISL